MRVGEGALGEQRRRDRHLQCLGQQDQIVRGLAVDDATTDVQHRLARVSNQIGCRPDVLKLARELRAVPNKVDRIDVLEVDLGQLEVLGDIHEHGAGSASARDVERLVDRLRDVLCLLDQERMLDDRHHDARDIGLLKSIGADQVRGHLAGDRDQRRRVEERVGNRRDQVRGARATGGDADADFAGGAGVALRHVARALLVAHQHVLNGVIDCHEGVVERQDRAAGDAPADRDVLGLERSDDRLRAEHALLARPCLLQIGVTHAFPFATSAAIASPTWSVVAEPPRSGVCGPFFRQWIAAASMASAAAG